MTASQAVGFNHVATLTPDLDRYVDFYSQVFGARLVSSTDSHGDHPRMAVIDVGGTSALHVFEVPEGSIVGNRSQIGGRGPIDHFALSVTSVELLERLRDRLVEVGASTGEITDFGDGLSVFFRDPDDTELEVCCHKPRDDEDVADELRLDELRSSGVDDRPN